MAEQPLDIAQDGGLFPREAVLAAVADADWRERAVPERALLCLALGLVFLALALPIRRPMVSAYVAGTSDGQVTMWVVEWLAHGLVWLGFGAERAWYVVAALGAGVGFLGCFVVTRALGIGARLALGVALALAFAPPAALGAVLPTPYGFASGASAILLWTQLAPPSTRPRAPVDSSLRPPPPGCPYASRASMLGAGFFLSGFEALLLTPLVLVALYSRRASDPPGRANGIGAVFSLTVAFAIGALEALMRWHENNEFDPILAELRPPLLALGLALAPIAALALTLFVRGTDTAEEARAPGWLRAAVPLALALTALSQSNTPPLVFGAALTPLAALGLANYLNRLTDPHVAARRLWLLGGALAALTLGLALAAHRWDRAPVTRIRAALAGGPALTAEDLTPEARYLLRFRFGSTPETALAR